MFREEVEGKDAEREVVVVLSDSNNEEWECEWLGKGRWLIDWVGGGGEGLQSGGDKELELGKAQRRKKKFWKR